MRYYMLNKPAGFVTACRDARHKTVMDLFPDELRAGLFPVGRLDRDTEGLLFVTDDGRFSHLLTEPSHRVGKTYFFYALGTLDEEKCRALETGVAIFPDRQRRTLPARAERLGVYPFRKIPPIPGEDPALLQKTRRGDLPVSAARLTVTEGKRHQIKRMVALR